ncbi:MAG TPA: NYN domain-containing protein [Methanomassiliicoccaceae archaeon]|nr:NYN domain-containing protein [Methanomassiliicoccaceae archaeon]HOK27407.1 NYN domain-containing protein [Methanomassiliicoccaceae archaeon]HQA21895.1 NYN domain-containing protein [Methanomassiliicoccaceae archaeon]
MTTVGIYVDGPNMERSLWDSGDVAILEKIGTLLVEYGSALGKVIEGRVFVDEGTMWRSDRTREDYDRWGFVLVESKSFRHIDPRTKRVVFGKSLTDPSMHCAVVDRLHDPDCPDVFVLATGDKDITIVLDYIYEHGKKASVLGEANSISSYLITRCDELGFGCHIVQLVDRSIKARKERRAPPMEVSVEELKVTDAEGRPIDMRSYVEERNVRSNQLNPNNIAYWRARGYSERPPDWERRAKKKRRKDRMG